MNFSFQIITKFKHGHVLISIFYFLPLYEPDFRDQMLNVVKTFSKSNQNGVFLNSCFAHCQSETQDTWFADDSPNIGNKVCQFHVISEEQYHRMIPWIFMNLFVVL